MKYRTKGDAIIYKEMGWELIAHIEQQDDEVYLCNEKIDHPVAKNYKTKRCGILFQDALRNVKKSDIYVPVFVSVDEYRELHDMELVEVPSYTLTQNPINCSKCGLDFSGYRSVTREFLKANLCVDGHYSLEGIWLADDGKKVPLSDGHDFCSNCKTVIKEKENV